MLEKGGELYDAETFKAGEVKASLVAIASRHSFQHGSKIIDEILERFHVDPKLIKEQS